MAKQKDYLTESDRNIFLTGKAGTGKTYQIKRFVEKCEQEGKQVLVCAPTGTAAVTADGETAHSLFGIPVPCYGVSITKTPAAKIKTLAAADVVIIDEVSMMRCDVFSYAIRVLRKAEKAKGSRIRVVVSGDFSQLPPVVQKNDIKFLKKFGYDESGYPFTTKEWESLHFKAIELTQIHRQEDGSEFTEMLAKVRDCDDSCIPYFWDFVKEDYEPKDTDIRLCGTNAEADEINRAYLESLPGNVVAYQAEKKGRGTAGIAEDIVLLKEGARVMFTVNDVVHNKYQNGTIGVVTKLTPKFAVVEAEGKEILVYPHEYKVYSYKVTNNCLAKNEIGRIKQMPLKVAAAITIHKSQGKTFDRVVLSPNIFAAGQLYVALSRVKSPEGLILTGEIKPEHLKNNPVVEEFYANGMTYEVKKPAKKEPASKTTTKKKTAKTHTTGKKASAGKKKGTVTKKQVSVSKKQTPGKKTAAKKTPATGKKTSKTPAKKKEKAAVSKKKSTAAKAKKIVATKKPVKSAKGR